MLFTPTTELLIDGAWVDITSDTYQGEGLSITRGRADEATAADPSNCALSIDNRSGDYSPRNPVGAHFGKIGRNTPLRVRMASSLPKYMSLPGVMRTVDGSIATSSYASTPDHASLDIVGDIDIRVDIEPCTWRPSGVFSESGTSTNDGYGLAQKADETVISWNLQLVPGGFLVFTWSDTGTGGALQRVSTVAVPATPGRLAVRVTLDVNNGAAGHDVRFYTAPTLAGSWVQLGATVTTAGVTSIFNSSAVVQVGGGPALLSRDLGFQGKVYGFELRSGIAGSLVASPDFTAQDTMKTAFTDAQSRPWTLIGNAIMAHPGARFHGEASKWPARWDKTGRDVRVPVQAYGIMGRLLKPTSPLRSVMHRWITSDTTSGVVAYWPCEDLDEAEEFASALPDGPPMLHPSGDTNNASFDQFKASAPLPTASLVQWTGRVPAYAATGQTQVRFLVAVPAGGVGSTAELLRIRAADLVGGGLNAALWVLSLGTGGSLKMEVFNNEGTSVHDTGFQAAGLNGKRALISIEIDDASADIDGEIKVYQVGVPGVSFQFSAFMTNRAFGRVERVATNFGGVMDTVALGHFSVQTALTGWTSADDDRLVAYKGEIAAARIMRLCREESIPVIIEGDSSDGALMGPQVPMGFVELLRETAESDMGILYEAREALALAYRTRGSLYSQEPTLTLDYEAKSVFQIEPTEDDDIVRNDITVTRLFGGSARAQDTTSNLSVEDPPAGVGRYEEAVPISLSRDDDLRDQACWRKHLGTVDEERYPNIGLTLGHSSFTADPALKAAAVALDVGDRVVIENMPEGIGSPEDVQQLTRGFTETFTGPEWLINMNCTPASPWSVAVWDEDSGVGEARYSSEGTELTEALPASGYALVLNGVSPGCATTPDVAALDIVGDLDVRVHAALTDWTPSATQTLVSKWTATGNQRSWTFNVLSTGILRFAWTTGGVTTLTADSTAAPVVSNGSPLWVKVTIDVNNGAAGRDIKFWTSADSVLWTQLGATVTQAGTTSIHSGSAPVNVGASDVGTLNRAIGKISAVEIRSGIDGTIVARPEFGGQEPGSGVFVDTAGRSWSLQSPAVYESVANDFFADVLAITTPYGPVWSSADAPYDVMIGGERMTVWTVNGAGPGQTMGVVRSVNGVIKGHAAGDDVELFKPGVYAL